MDEKKIKMHLPKIDDLFITQEERDNINNEKVIELDINNIDDFHNHNKGIVNREYVNIRKNSFYSRVQKSNESLIFLNKTRPLQ